jgi:hypothetical protein
MGRSPHDATSPLTAVPPESIAPIPPPRPTQSSRDTAIWSPCAPRGKFPFVPLPSLPFPSPNAVFPPLPTPRLADALDALLAYQHPPTRPSEFRFEWSADAAAHNWELLRRYDCDLASAILAQPFSTLTFGSEFRPAHLFAPLLSLHPLWGRFAERITDGAAFPLLDISDDDQLSSVRANLARGNHKSVRNHEHSLISMFKGEVERGWQLPLPKEAALVILGCEVAPLGMEGFQQVSVPHLVPEEDQDGRTHLYDKRRLQIRIQTDPATGAHGSEGMHVH